jgi:hypothetical protein
MKDLKTKQISIVLEADENFDELGLMMRLKDFLASFKKVNWMGTHVKILKPQLRREHEENI